MPTVTPALSPVTGITVRDAQQKVSAYADYMIFSLTNHLISLPNLIKEFERYGALSNLQIQFYQIRRNGN